MTTKIIYANRIESNQNVSNKSTPIIDWYFGSRFNRICINRMTFILDAIEFNANANESFRSEKKITQRNE